VIGITWLIFAVAVLLVAGVHANTIRRYRRLGQSPPPAAWMVLWVLLVEGALFIGVAMVHLR
jgi:hypothetical protein